MDTGWGAPSPSRPEGWEVTRLTLSPAKRGETGRNELKACPKRQEQRQRWAWAISGRGWGGDPQGFWVRPLQSEAQHPGRSATRQPTSQENPARLSQVPAPAGASSGRAGFVLFVLPPLPELAGLSWPEAHFSACLCMLFCWRDGTGHAPARQHGGGKRGGPHLPSPQGMLSPPLGLARGASSQTVLDRPRSYKRSFQGSRP